MVFIFISAIAYALSSVLIKKYSAKSDPVMLSGYQFTAGGLVMILIGFVMVEESIRQVCRQWFFWSIWRWFLQLHTRCGESCWNTIRYPRYRSSDLRIRYLGWSFPRSFCVREMYSEWKTDRTGAGFYRNPDCQLGETGGRKRKRNRTKMEPVLKEDTCSWYRFLNRKRNNRRSLTVKDKL